MLSTRSIPWFLLTFSLVAAEVPARFVGTVQGIRAETGEVDVKPDQGELRTSKLIPETQLQRVAPGEKDLKNAKPIQITDVHSGDRVLVAVEPGTNDLRRLVVMPAADIAQRNEADRLDWQKRGVSGVVTSKNGDLITLKMRSFSADTQAIVTVSGKTAYRRYAPDSVKFADARQSGINEVAIGDQLRARGDKAVDGSKVTAEEVVFGTFITKVGKISAIDAEKQEITILELNSNQPLLIKLTADSQMKQMPSFPGMPGGGMPGGGMPPGGMPLGGMRPPDLSQMLEHMPPAKLADLQPGQSIVVSSTKGATKGQVTAITLLANADMLIRMATAQSPAASGRSPASMGQMPAGGMPSGMEGLQLPGLVP